MSSTKPLPEGVPMRNGKPDLPPGIRLHNGKLKVDKSRVVNGKQIGRFTAHADTYLEALTKAAEFEKKLDLIAKGGVPVEDDDKGKRPPFDWTLKQAVEFMERTPAPYGWSGQKSIKTHRINSAFALEFFGEDCFIAEIKRRDLDSWCEWLENEHDNSNATVNRKISCISKVMTVCEDQSEDEETGENLYKKPKMPPRRKEHTDKRRILRLDRSRDVDEESDFLNFFYERGDLDAYDATCVLLDTGMRLSECFSVEEFDFIFETGMLEIYGPPHPITGQRSNKNEDYRAVPLPERSTKIFKKRVIDQGMSRPFPFTKDWYWRKFDEAKQKLGLGDDSKLTPHSLRHTCCTRLIAEMKGSDYDLPQVQKWMGHKEIQTTMRYIHLVPQNLSGCADTLNNLRKPPAAPEPAKPNSDPLTLFAEMVKLLEEEYGQDGIEKLKSMVKSL